MNKLLVLISFWFIVDAYGAVIRGVAGNIDTTNNTITMRSADRNYVVRLDRLSPALRTSITAPSAKLSIQNFDVPDSAISSNVSAPMRADCSELPVSMTELDRIAGQSRDFLTFLNNIPQGTLQGFTFVRESQSIQKGVPDPRDPTRGAVSDMWPRVLRASIDGKITISFVCDPRNPAYGKVEIISWDNSNDEFKTTEYDFTEPFNPANPSDRIHQNPTSCISCHEGSMVKGKPSLKPNWPEYFVWSDCVPGRGIRMYGSNDDNMGVGNYRSFFMANSTKKAGCGDTGIFLDC